MVQPRRGFALLAVLWILVGITVLAFGASLVGRSAIASARNRTALTEARWIADGCAERVHAAVQDTLNAIPPSDVIATWDAVDKIVATSPLLAGTHCQITVRAAGAALSLNTADAEQLTHFFMALGIGAARADSLTDALLDWCDADTIPRPLGAERRWYANHHRLLPRDSAFADVREVLRVRGFEQFGDTLSLLGVDSAAVPLSHASAPVLSSLPGLSPAAIARLGEMQRRGERLSELIVLGGSLPVEDRALMTANYRELSTLTTSTAERWIMTIVGSSDTPKMEATLKVQLARAGTRVAVLGRQ